MSFSSSCRSPSAETQFFLQWKSGIPTVGQWKAQVSPLADDFEGRLIREADGGGGQDYCWWSQSQLDPENYITPAPDPWWSVTSGNYYQVDSIGFFPDYIEYYRNQNRVPCGNSLNQQLWISCPSGDIHYLTQSISAGLDSSTVYSGRAAESSRRLWPAP